MKILYIYGYGGSATGSTVTTLKRLMPEGYSVEAFTYTQADCAKRVKRFWRTSVSTILTSLWAVRWAVLLPTLCKVCPAF